MQAIVEYVFNNDWLVALGGITFVIFYSVYPEIKAEKERIKKKDKEQ